MKLKLFLPTLTLITVLLLTGCGGQPTGPAGEDQTTGNKTADSGCTAGYEKSVAGLKYERIGAESQMVQGQSVELCCWYHIGSQGQKTKKICGDRDESPVGYSTGILWEMESGTGEAIKSVETYPKDGKSCQQHYEKDGTAGPESCK